VRKSIQSIGRQAPEDGLRAPTSLQPVAAGVAISLYAAWNARRLHFAWLYSPYDRGDSVAFLLWIMPIAFLWVRRLSTGRPARVSSAAFAIGLVISFAGVATDLSVLEYLGLAVALAGFLPIQPATVPWLACAAAWMPAAGWAFSAHGSVLVNSMRVAVGVAALLLTPLFLRNDSTL
jgi:hypothetical protein